MPKTTIYEEGITPPTIEELNELKMYVADIGDTGMEWDIFQKKYKDIKLLIPKIGDFLIFKRNQCIKSDYEKGMDKTDISKLYELSIKTINEIVKE